MRKERVFWISLVSVILSILFLNLNVQFSKAKENDERAYIKIFESVYNNLRTSYIDEKEPKELLIGAINGMIKILDDPHTALLEPKQKEDLEIETSGQYGGLGIEVGIRDNKLTVISPMDDTPAERAGIKEGDRILKINDEAVVNPDLKDVVNKLRGAAGTEVKISVERDGIDELLDFKLKREVINLKSVKSDIVDDIAYIRLISFRKNSPAEMQAVLDDVAARKVKGIILDLRNNSGGLLDVAIKIANFFLKEGLIVYTKPRETALSYYSSLNRKFFAQPGNAITDKEQLIVLINGGTASASEILAGAIKDQRRGILIGTKSFGKGSVQSVINLDEGYGLRFTTAYYYTPNGTKIHKIGIEPDIEIEMPRISKEEIRDINKVRAGKYIETFIAEKPKWEEKDVDALTEKLKGENINLSRIIIRKLIRQEQYKNRKEPLYDLDFDTQLKMAVQILKAELNLQK